MNPIQWNIGDDRRQFLIECGLLAVQILRPNTGTFWQPIIAAVGTFDGISLHHDEGPMTVKPPPPAKSWQFYKWSDWVLQDPVTPAVEILKMCEAVAIINRVPITPELKAQALEKLISGHSFSSVGVSNNQWPYKITETWHSATEPSRPLGLFKSERPIPSFDIGFSLWGLEGTAWLPVYAPFFRRRARKWGRSLTKRWEDEHRQLVDHRKFERNRKKVIVDPSSIGTGKRKKKKKVRTPLMERTLLNSILNRGEASAKRAALKAASKGRTTVRKHIEKRGAKKVQTAVKKALRNFGTGPAESLKKKPIRKGSR